MPLSPSSSLFAAAPGARRGLRALLLALAVGPGAALAGDAAPAVKPTAAPAYSGHGAASIAPEVIARFAAPALPPEVSRRIQSMLDVRGLGGGQVSPDGKQLYFAWNITGISQVWRLDGADRFPVQLTGGEDRTAPVGMAPDGSFVLVSRDRNGEENPGLYLLEARGGPLTLLQHTPGVQTFADFISDDSRFIYFHANDVSPAAYALYRYDRQSHARELVFGEEGLWSVADHQPDGRLLMQKEVGSNMAEFYEYTPATKKLTPLIGVGEREDYDVAYAAQAGELLVRTPRLGNFRRLYRFKPGGALVPVTPELKADVDSFAIDQARQRIYYTVNEAGYTRLLVLDARTFQSVPLPRLPAADHVTLASVTPDGRFASLALDPGTSPHVSYVLDWKTRQVAQWQRPSAPEVELSTFARATLESYPARDGTPIPMFVRRPARCEKEACPVVVSFHGGPESQAQAGFSPTAQLFVEAGFVFVQPNVRGSDGYGKQWLHADDGPKRLDVITDIEDCARFIREKWARGGKAPRIGIYGGSYGGYSSLVGMTLFSGAYDAGVAIVGMSNLVTFLQNTAPYRRSLRISEYGDPDKDREALLKLSPITYVDRVKAPLLVIQGASDPRVPVGEALQIHQSLDEKKIPNQLIIFADEGHGASKRGNLVAQTGHAVRFFEQYLGRP